MRTATIAMLALVLSGCSGNGGGSTDCTTGSDCGRGLVCASGTCKEVACTSSLECAKDYDASFCYVELGVCTSIECGLGTLTCLAGTVCKDLLCQEEKPQCYNNSGCKQPAEKCYKGQCRPADYCEAGEDCPSANCSFEDHVCLPPVEDVKDAGEGIQWDIEEDLTCEKPYNPPDVLTYLCAACETGEQCACGWGKCLELGNGKFCVSQCDADPDCPSGYTCQEKGCRPLGGQCKACTSPPGCTEPGKTCDFKTGDCMDRVAWCGTCAFDFECGFGNRCFTKAGSPPICVPECGETFDCPPASGCEDRGDGTYVCVSNAKTCCYGPDCDTCTCQEPKPLCLDINTCVECLGSNDCPPDKPICIPEKYECHIVCTAPTPARYIDPETGAETCVECTKSLDCPAGLLCGTFAGDPEKYHKCYQSQ